MKEPRYYIWLYGSPLDEPRVWASAATDLVEAKTEAQKRLTLAGYEGWIWIYDRELTDFPIAILKAEDRVWIDLPYTMSRGEAKL